MTQLDRALAAPTDAVAASDAISAQAVATPLSDLFELTKPRITRMVLITTGVGFALAAMGRSWGALELVSTAALCIIGAALSASGASALNQWWERASDAKMARTSDRPLPAGRLSPRSALLLGAGCSLAGVLTLLIGVNAAAALVSAVTITLYILAYTPLKPVTPLATLVGAAPGALPPLIGWTAASATSGGAWESLTHAGGWSLFLVMLVWQVPHVLAIAWMYRDDYAKGGHRVLPVMDPLGIRTGRVALIWAYALLPVSLAPVMVMPVHLGWVYIVTALVADAAMIAAAARFALLRTRERAKTLFFVSILYLPLLLLTMVAGAAASVALL